MDQRVSHSSDGAAAGERTFADARWNEPARTDATDVLDNGRRSSRRRLTIIVAVLIALALAGYIIWKMMAGGEAAKKEDGTADNIPTVTVMQPGTTTVERTINATGTLAARREMPVGIAGEGGQIARVLVEPGQWVGQGQVLATIDRQVQAQQLESLAAQIRVAQADANLAQADLNRAQQLVANGFVSKADLDRRTATRDAANARLSVARAQLSEAQARTRRLDIRAPAAGLILTRQVEPGQVVSAGSGPLFRMARGGEMELMAEMSETDLLGVSVGTRAIVTPVGTDLKVAGQVWQVSPVVNPQTRQGTARIAVPYSTALRPGGFASATLIAGAANAPLLPETAVQSDDKGNFVYIVGTDNKVVRRDVKVGSVSDAGLPIIGGLDGTEKIVVSAGAFLNPGDAVKPVLQKTAGASAAAPAPAATPPAAPAKAAAAPAKAAAQ